MNLEKPPFITPVQRLMDIINSRMDNNVSQPAMMPESQQKAAEWWMTKQEPMAKDEAARLEWVSPKRATDVRKQVWFTPYADRLCHTIAAYYRLTHAEQMYIMDLQSQGIWWRGDSMKFMKMLAKVDMARIDKSKLKGMLKTIIARAQVN